MASESERRMGLFEDFCDAAQIAIFLKDENKRALLAERVFTTFDKLYKDIMSCVLEMHPSIEALQKALGEESATPFGEAFIGYRTIHHGMRKMLMNLDRFDAEMFSTGIMAQIQNTKTLLKISDEEANAIAKRLSDEMDETATIARKSPKEIWEHGWSILESFPESGRRAADGYKFIMQVVASQTGVPAETIGTVPTAVMSKKQRELEVLAKKFSSLVNSEYLRKDLELLGILRNQLLGFMAQHCVGTVPFEQIVETKGVSNVS